ncbi:hypothetical protein MU448_12230 [Streptococcus sp. O1]|uniref:hypothetical protein n=1 Tax=Streptococcus sp. O1 TaxID=2928735 RepID=UPI00211AA782|nr:hypothetical protein [Streptococcus sp. O1]MCQ9215104.1 hypothetical protein [Streptococcus sp. O1]
MEKTMSKENNTNLYQFKGGNIIKQNDYSSNFVYELQDDRYQKFQLLTEKKQRLLWLKS